MHYSLNPFLLSRRQTTLIARLTLIALLIVGVSSCGEEQRKQGQDLVKNGTATSDRLAKYYDNLGTRRSIHKERTIFELKRAGTSLSPTLGKQYTQQLEALSARANMARKLKDTYEALGQLIEYDAPTEITGAVVDLKKSLEDVSKKKLPGPFGVDPEVILKKAVTALIQWEQLRQFRKNAPKAEIVLKGITDLYQAELPIYIQISQDYNKIVYLNAKYLYERNQLTLTSFFTKDAEMYGLQMLQRLPSPPAFPNIATPGKPTPAERLQIEKYKSDLRNYQDYVAAMKAYAMERLDTQLKQYDDGSDKEARGNLNALVKLERKHEDFMLKRKPPKEEVAGMTQLKNLNNFAYLNKENA